MIRILIVDDHPVVRAGVRTIIETQPDFHVIGEADSGEEAVRRVAYDTPDLVLIDLQMPGIGGAQAVTQIMGLADPPQVVILTTYDTDSDILTALDAGAIGYLLKDAPPDQLFQAIRQAASGQTVLAPSVASKLITRVQRQPSQTLSTRELQVLDLVADGLSNKQIAQQLHLSEATIKTHLAHVNTKLGVESRTAAVAAAVEQGLIRHDTR